MSCARGGDEKVELNGKVAIITGSGRGIGEAIAKQFAFEGACVVVNDISEERANRVADEIKEKHGEAIAIKADIAKKTEVRDLVNRTVNRYEAVHILVNNAGIVRNAPFLEKTEEEWDIVLDIDQKGVFLCTQAVLPHMITQQYGKIVNISSVAGTGTSGTENMANYAAAKGGVIQLTKVTARIGAPWGINVNCIAPGLIITEALRTIGRGGSSPSDEEFEKFLEAKKGVNLLKFFGKPENIADLAVFLASDYSNYITGQLICIDGGRTDRL